MSFDNHFSENDPQVLEAVEKQYLYGRTKDVLRNVENDILDIVQEVVRCHRLEIEYPNYSPTLELISIALVGLRKRHFSGSEMKLLDVSKRRICREMDRLLDIFDPRESEYGRVSSRLVSALHSLNPFISDGRDILTERDGVNAQFIEGMLSVIDTVEGTVAAVRSKLTPKRKDKDDAPDDTRKQAS